MKTREWLAEYFTTRIRNAGFYSDQEINKIIDSKTTEELQKNYNHIQWIELEEKEILQSGLVTYKLNYNGYKQEKTDEQELISYLRKNKMYSYDEGRINLRLHIGGNIILGIPKKFIESIRNEFPNINFSVDEYILGKDTIKQFSKGDKVKITVTGVFGNTVEQGTVRRVQENELIVRKYRARTTNFILTAGEECKVEKIETFMKSIT